MNALNSKLSWRIANQTGGLHDWKNKSAVNSLLSTDNSEELEGIPPYAQSNPFLRKAYIQQLLKHGVTPKTAEFEKDAAGFDTFWKTLERLQRFNRGSHLKFRRLAQWCRC